MKNSTLKNITWITSISFLVLVPLSYFLFFNQNELSKNPESWAQFGDFFGGILNPIISLINLIILTYLSIRLVKDENNRNKWTLQELARPYGDFSFTKEHYRLTISVKNCGLGPMIIKNIQIIKNDEIHNDFEEIISQTHLPKNIRIHVYKISTHSIISKENSASLLRIEGENTTETIDFFKEIYPRLSSYTIKLEYEDMYKRKMETLNEKVFFE